MVELLTLIAFAFAIVAIQRTKRYYQQLAALESEVRQLRALLDAVLRRGGAGIPRTEAEAPAAAAPVVEPERVVSVPPPPVRIVEPPPPVAEPPPPPPRHAEPGREEPAAPRMPPPVGPPPSAEPPHHVDWERFAGVRAAG